MATQQLNRLASLLKSLFVTQLGGESDGTLLDRCRAGVRKPRSRRSSAGTVAVLAACRKVLGRPMTPSGHLSGAAAEAASHSQKQARPVVYGVAHRIAVRARHGRSRRGLLKSIRPQTKFAAPDLSWRGVRLLHEELDKLPYSVQLPLVLCYLDGLSRDEAAHQLGWSLNQVRGRLERGRDRLRKRLERRGIALSAGLLATVAGNSVTAGGPSARLIESVMRAAHGHPTARALALANGASLAMFARFKVVSAIVLVAGVLIGAGTQHPGLHAGPKPGDPKQADKSHAKEAPAEAVTSSRRSSPAASSIPTESRVPGGQDPRSLLDAESSADSGTCNHGRGGPIQVQ